MAPSCCSARTSRSLTAGRCSEGRRMAVRYYTVTWDQLHRDAKALAWRLVEKGPWKGIVAITRGGLIPSAVIARELECRLIEAVSIVTYDEEKKGEPRVLKPPVAALEA